MRRPRTRASQARRPGRHGDPPRGTMTPRVYRYAMTAAFERQCSKAFRSANARSAVNAKCDPETVNRRAERRRAPRSLRQGDAHAPAGACSLPGATSALRPLGLRGETPAVPRRGTRAGHPRGRPRPRRISLGCLTTWLFDIVNRTRARGPAPVTPVPRVASRWPSGSRSRAEASGFRNPTDFKASERFRTRNHLPNQSIRAKDAPSRRGQTHQGEPSCRTFRPSRHGLSPSPSRPC